MTNEMLDSLFRYDNINNDFYDDTEHGLDPNKTGGAKKIDKKEYTKFLKGYRKLYPATNPSEAKKAFEQYEMLMKSNDKFRSTFDRKYAVHGIKSNPKLTKAAIMDFVKRLKSQHTEIKKLGGAHSISKGPKDLLEYYKFFFYYKQMHPNAKLFDPAIVKKYLTKKQKPKTKKVKGGSILSKGYKLLANAYRKVACNGKARPLEDGELHPLCANYEGPGTRIDLHPDTPPYNNIDNCARIHDFEYADIKKEPDLNKRARMVQEADRKAVDCFDKFKDEQPYYSLGKLGLSGKLSVDKLLAAIGQKKKIYGT